MNNLLKCISFVLISFLTLNTASVNAPFVRFDKPADGQHFDQGNPIEVEVIAIDETDGIAYVDLFLNQTNNRIDREYHEPYEFSSVYDAKLRNLPPGQYELIAIATDNRGSKTRQSIQIYVDRVGTICESIGYLAGFEFVKPRSGIVVEYDYGDPIDVEVAAPAQIAYMDLYLDDCHTHIRRENRAPYQWKSEYDPRLKNLAPGSYTLIAVATDHHGVQYTRTKDIKVVPAQANCHWEEQFRYRSDHPGPGGDAYVELNFESGIQDIEYIDLNVNGQHYGREYHWPYQWGRGFRSNGSTVLNNMHPGTYDLVWYVTDKCGRTGEVTNQIRIAGLQNGKMYNFNQYQNNYPITNLPGWARVSNYASPIVGTHGLKRQKSMKVSRGRACAIDYWIEPSETRYTNLMVYVPEGKEALLGFYDENFNTVFGYRLPPASGNAERWQLMTIETSIYTDNSGTSFSIWMDDGTGTNVGRRLENKRIKYLVFHGEQNKNEYYIDDVYSWTETNLR